MEGGHVKQCNDASLIRYNNFILYLTSLYDIRPRDVMDEVGVTLN